MGYVLEVSVSYKISHLPSEAFNPRKDRELTIIYKCGGWQHSEEIQL